MIKKIRLTIDLTVNIPEKISPALIEKIIAEKDTDRYLTNYKPLTEKHQAFIDFIKNNDDIYAQCITGSFYFKLNEHGFDDELEDILQPKHFDQRVIEAAGSMDKETAAFIIQLYEETRNQDKDAEIDEEGKPIPQVNSKKAIIESIKRDIDREIIQLSLMDYNITAVSFTAVKNGSKKVAENPSE